MRELKDDDIIDLSGVMTVEEGNIKQIVKFCENALYPLNKADRTETSDSRGKAFVRGQILAYQTIYEYAEMILIDELRRPDDVILKDDD